MSSLSTLSSASHQPSVSLKVTPTVEGIVKQKRDTRRASLFNFFLFKRLSCNGTADHKCCGKTEDSVQLGEYGKNKSVTEYVVS